MEQGYTPQNANLYFYLLPKTAASSLFPTNLAISHCKLVNIKQRVFLRQIVDVSAELS